MAALQMPEVTELLRTAKDETARALRRMDKRTLTHGQRQELTAWAGVLRINRGMATNTAARYVDNVGEFLEWLNKQDKSMETASPADVQAWVQHLLVGKNEGSNTRGGKLTALRQFGKFRKAQGWPGDNPAADVPGPRRDKKQPAKFGTLQLQRMFATCNQDKPMGRRDYAILLLFYTTGMRREELVALDLEQLTLSERAGVVRLHGKGNKERTVSFEGEPVRALQAWLADRDSLATDSPAVFLTLAGSAGRGQRLGLTGVEGVVSRAVKKASIKPDGKPMGCHRLRSTFATDLYDEGVRIEAIQVLMGHNSYETTRGYIVISDRQLKTRMPTGRINEVLGKQAGTAAYLGLTGPGKGRAQNV